MSPFKVRAAEPVENGDGVSRLFFPVQLIQMQGECGDAGFQLGKFEEVYPLEHFLLLGIVIQIDDIEPVTVSMGECLSELRAGVIIRAKNDDEGHNRTGQGC